MVISRISSASELPSASVNPSEDEERLAAGMTDALPELALLSEERLETLKSTGAQQVEERSRSASPERSHSVGKIIKTLIGLGLLVSGVSGLISNFSHGSAKPASMHTLTISIINSTAIGSPDSQATLAALAGGVPVTVSDQSGVVIGSVGDVFPGSPVAFKVPTESFYKITVGNFGTVTYSYSEVAGNNWKAPVMVS